MATVLSGAGSTVLHALTSASAQSLSASKIQGQSLWRDDNGSTVVTVTVASEDRVPLSTIYYGAEGTVAKAFTNASIPTADSKIRFLDMARDTDGSVHLLASLCPDSIPLDIYAGTGSLVGEAITNSGISAVSDPRVAFQKVAIDTLGSVTVIFGVGDERIPN